MIGRDLSLRRALRARSQRGFIIDPFRFGSAPVTNTWNPSDKDADVTLSGGNLIATVVSAGSTTGAVRAITGRLHTDNAYFEVTLSSSDINQLAGIGKAAASLASYPGSDANSYGGYPYANSHYTNGSATTNYITNTVVGVDVDLTAGTIRFVVAGKVLANAFTGISGTLYPMWGPATGAVGTRTGTLNTGGSAFTYALPSGATAWGGTWNSADKDADITLSGSDLIATLVSSGSQTGSLRGTQGRSSGRYYFEVTYGSGADHMIGVGKATATLTDWPGKDANGWGYYIGAHLKYTNGASGGAVAQATTTVVGVWLNSGTLKYIFDGATGANSNTGLSGTFYPMWGPGTTAAATRVGTLNVGGTAFSYSLPSGASAWG